MSYDLEKMTFEWLVNYHSGRLLEQFVSEGGKGLRSALWSAMYEAIQWSAEKKGKDKK